MNEDEVISFEALYRSMWKCKCGTIWKNPVASYVLNGIEQTIKLESELKEGRYKPRKPSKFLVKYPKERETLSIPFRDRVYQRSMNDNALYPEMTRHFIYDNMACQKGKGTDKAMNRLNCFMQKAFRKYGYDCYVLQIDIHHYYQSMEHKMVKDAFREYVEPKICLRVEKALDDQYSGDIGYNPGSQMVQIAGISVPNHIDHFIKESLKIKYYVRYMDDFILIHNNREYLEQCRDEIGGKLSELHLEYHPKKTQIYNIRQGIVFLGFRFKVTKTGKIVRFINPGNVKHERRKLARMVHKAGKGEMNREKIDECYRAWKNHAERGNSGKLIKRMDKRYLDLWRKENDCKEKDNPDCRSETH